MEHVRDDDLQMYFDAELTEAASATVRRHLVECADCKGRLRVLERLHSFVEMAAEDVSVDLPTEAMFATVSAGIAKQPATPLRVVSGGGRKWIAPVVAVTLAAAAAVLIFVLTQPPAPSPGARAPGQRRPRNMIADETPEPARGTSVHDVNFGENTGTVF